jgi:histidyl-tRNA synthetase
MEVLPAEGVPANVPGIFLAALGPAAKDRGLAFLQELRDAGLAVEMDFDDRSLKAQMSLADRLEARWVVILGDRELAAGEAAVRDMADGSQEAVPLAELKARLKTVAAAKEGN